jgi:hypothetical protein
MLEVEEAGHFQAGQLDLVGQELVVMEETQPTHQLPHRQLTEVRVVEAVDLLQT